jgi:hypothetical protein
LSIYSRYFSSVECKNSSCPVPNSLFRRFVFTRLPQELFMPNPYSVQNAERNRAVSQSQSGVRSSQGVGGSGERTGTHGEVFGQCHSVDLSKELLHLPMADSDQRTSLSSKLFRILIPRCIAVGGRCEGLFRVVSHLLAS